MSDPNMIMNFANNQPRLLTGIGQGLAGLGGKIVNQIQGRRANEAYTEAFDTFGKDVLNEENRLAFLKAAQGVGKFDEGIKMVENMEPLAKSNKLTTLGEDFMRAYSGDTEGLIGSLEAQALANENDGNDLNNGEAKALRKQAELIKEGKTDAYLTYQGGIISMFGEDGTALLDNIRAQGKYESDIMKTDVEVVKILDDLNITSPEQKERIGNALAQMPSGMGDTLKQFLTVRTALDNGDMTLAELGKAEENLRAEFDDYTKPYRTIIENVNGMEAMLQDPTGAVDFGVVRMFNKALDPNSVVRESEAAGTAAATDLLDRTRAKLANLTTGQGIGTELRKDILAASKILAAGADENVAKQFNRLNETVKDFGYKDTRIWDKGDIERYSNYSSSSFEEEVVSEGNAVPQASDPRLTALRAHVKSSNPQSTADFDSMTEEQLSKYNAYKSFEVSEDEAVVEVSY